MRDVKQSPPGRSGATTSRPRPSRTPSGPLLHPMTRSGLLTLQRLAGNRAVVTALQRNGLTPIQRNYSHLSVTSAGATLANSGAFLGASAGEYKEAQKRLGKARQPSSEADIRFEMLLPKIEEAWEKLKNEQKKLTLASLNGGGRPLALGVFTAPEWFFKRPHSPFSAAEKNAIIDRFQNLSKRLPDLLLTPGTIMWLEAQDDLPVLRNTGFAVLNGHLLKVLNKSENAGDTEGYFAIPGDKSTADLPSRQVAEEAYARGSGPRIGQHGGHTGAIQGDSSHFDVGTLRVSLEICGDHANIARAKSDVKVGQGPSSGVDLQILIAHGGQYARGSDVTRPGGVFVFNDAGDAGSGGERKVWRNDMPYMGWAATQVGPGPAVGANAASMGDFHVSATEIQLPARTPEARLGQLKGTVPQALKALTATSGKYNSWATTLDTQIDELTAGLNSGEDRYKGRARGDNQALLHEATTRRHAGRAVAPLIGGMLKRAQSVSDDLAADRDGTTPQEAGRRMAAIMGRVAEELEKVPPPNVDAQVSYYQYLDRFFDDLVTAGV